MSKIIGNNLPDMPWQEKPAGEHMPVWRYDQNPIIGRYEQKRSNSIFNSAVVPFEDGYVGVFRCDSRSISMDIFVGRSKDGIHWEIEDEPIKFEGADEEILTREYRYDPRVCKIDDKYYVTWCNGYHGPTIGVAYTYDFKKFVQLENAFLPFNRNGVLFPRKINGYYMMMSRPSALLDIDEPWKVKYRTKDYIMAPITQYECMGDVPNVVFPCATLSDAATGRITIYYGCADTVTGMAFTTVDELLNYVKENSL